MIKIQIFKFNPQTAITVCFYKEMEPEIGKLTESKELYSQSFSLLPYQISLIHFGIS